MRTIPATLSIIVLAGLMTVSCGGGPGIIDRPDYSSFVDISSAGDDGQNDGMERDAPHDDSFIDDSSSLDADQGDSGDSDIDGDLATHDHGDATEDVESLDATDDDAADPDALANDATGNLTYDGLDARDSWNDTAPEVTPDDAQEDVAGPYDAGPDSDTVEYTGIYAGMDEMTGTTLVKAICPLVRNNTTTVSYDSAKDILREDVDNHGGQIREIYTGQWWDPDASIINVEHTWPQSKGAGSAPMQGDMHHLYLSHSHYNSARSNYPFGNVTEITYDGNDVAPFPDEDCTDKFADSDWTGCMTYVGYDSLGDRVCEPRDSHKGNTARAVFYFQLRYGTSNCALKPLSDFDEYGSTHVALTESTLKEWNRKDPPDDDERYRNTRIAAHEGVRNPFIDHPEFVDRIDFTP